MAESTAALFEQSQEGLLLQLARVVQLAAIPSSLTFVNTISEAAGISAQREFTLMFSFTSIAKS